MLDPDEMAAYEAWKEHKLISSVDISVSAFNLEAESTAVAFEAGVDALSKQSKGGASEDDVATVKAVNPYRQKGMTGYRPPETKRVSS